MLYCYHDLRSCINVAFKNYKDIETTNRKTLKSSFKKILATEGTFQLNFKKKLRNIYKLLKLIIEM